MTTNERGALWDVPLFRWLRSPKFAPLTATAQRCKRRDVPASRDRFSQPSGRKVYRTSRSGIGVALLLAVACESPSATTTEAVSEDITLTADDPVAAFEVRLCVTDDAPAEFDGSGSFSAEARVNVGSAELTLENLAVDPDYNGPEDAPDPVELVPLSDSQSSIAVILTTTLDGLSSGQCSETQVVQFSVRELEPGQTVTIAGAQAFFGGDWAESFCPSGFSDTSLYLEVDRI